MTTTNTSWTDETMELTEFRKNPLTVVQKGDGEPVSILRQGQPVFYVIPPETFERMMDALEDVDLLEIIREREDMAAIEVSLDAL